MPFWKLFVKLCIARTNNGFGENPIPYSEIESLLNIHKINDVKVRIRATELIRLMDTIYLTESRAKAEGKRNAARS